VVLCQLYHDGIDETLPAFLTPANAMLSVELNNLADILDAVKLHQNATFARNWSKTIKNAIYQHTLVDDIFAYETNGYGARYVMDDANVPVRNAKGVRVGHC
jgi:hypothetical protein